MNEMNECYGITTFKGTGSANIDGCPRVIETEGIVSVSVTAKRQLCHSHQRYLKPPVPHETCLILVRASEMNHIGSSYHSCDRKPHDTMNWQDGAPPNSRREFRDFLNYILYEPVGCAVLITWPPSSPDLTLDDIFV